MGTKSKRSTEAPREDISQRIWALWMHKNTQCRSEFGGKELEYIFLSASGKNVFAIEISFNK